MKRIMQGIIVVVKYYCICVGILITIVVGHKMVMDHLNPVPVVRAQLNIKLPPATFSNQPSKGVKQ